MVLPLLASHSRKAWAAGPRSPMPCPPSSDVTCSSTPARRDWKSGKGAAAAPLTGSAPTRGRRPAGSPPPGRRLSGTPPSSVSPKAGVQPLPSSAGSRARAARSPAFSAHQHGLPRRLPQEHPEVLAVVRQDGAERTGPEGLEAVPQRDRAAVEREVVLHHRVLLRLLVGLEVLPEHRLAVAGIAGAPHARLVAVVDHGGAHARHLQEPPGDAAGGTGPPPACRSRRDAPPAPGSARCRADPGCGSCSPRGPCRGCPRGSGGRRSPPTGRPCAARPGGGPVHSVAADPADSRSTPARASRTRSSSPRRRRLPSSHWSARVQISPEM